MRITDISFNGSVYYPYQLRIDISCNHWVHYDDAVGPDVEPVSATSCLNTHLWCPYFHPVFNYIKATFKYALVAEERSDSGKYHLQCFCLHTRSLDDKELLKIRYYIKAKFADSSRKQPVSIKKSHSPLGLFHYCQKDGEVHLNMPPALFHHLTALAKANCPDTREQVLRKAAQKAASLRDLVRRLLQQVEFGALKCVPRKAVVWRLAVRHKLIDFDTFYAEFYSPR